MSDNAEFKLVIPPTTYATLVATQGDYFGPLSRTAPDKIASDVVSQDKADRQAAILQRHAPLRGKQVLEVGAGLGTNVICWIKGFGADMVGIEPDSDGFGASFKLAHDLAAANAVDTKRIVNAVGESLPYPDHSFDVVFSANVLEHTNEPAKVLHESLRVLRPGGVLQFVFPNYHSYYDGHYGVFHPPIPWRGFFPWYVKWIWRRDPAFARTLRTELNVVWVKRQLAILRKDYSFDVLGLGDELFLERMTSLDFTAWASLGRVKRILDWIGKPSIRRALAKIIIAMRGWTPIVLTLRKKT